MSCIKLIITCFCLCVIDYCFAQNNVFGELTGSPNINTSGWKLTGNAYTGDTDGDSDAFENELILTNTSSIFQSGGVFYGTVLNPLICSKWTVEFDYRIWGGSIADGLAFCFLDVPPSGFVNGEGIGIPGSAKGLKVVIDTWNNCGETNPEIQIYYGTGYEECAQGIVKINNSTGNLNFVRKSVYQSARITYENGLIRFFINNQPYLSANFTINFPGYLGFTASTGTYTDFHSLKNVKIYTEQATSNAGTDKTVCESENVEIGTTSNSNYIYSWSPSTGLNNTGISNPTVNLSNNTNSPIIQQYTVTTFLASNPGNCPSTDQVSVTILPDFVNNQTKSICKGDSIWFNSSFLKNEGNYTSVLSSKNGCDSTINLKLSVNQTYLLDVDTTFCEGKSIKIGAQNYSSSGQYTIKLQNISGCDSVINLKINVLPLPNLSCNSATICQGDTAVLSPSGANLYSWNPDQGRWNQNGNYLVKPSSTTTYILTGTHQNGCSKSLSVQVVVENLPNVKITSPKSNYCVGEEIVLSAQGASSYQWFNFINSTSNQQVFQALKSDTYRLKGTNSSGCQNEDSISIGVFPIPQLEITPQQEICEGDSALISVKGANTYSWSPQGFGNSTYVSPTQTTTYFVVGFNEGNCSSQVSTSIIVSPKPKINLVASPQIAEIDFPVIQFFNKSSDLITSILDFGDGNTLSPFENSIEHRYPSSEGTYMVKLMGENQFGCSATERINVRIIGDKSIYVPNSFSPNGDEINQEFCPVLSNGFDPNNYTLEIYNRWGELIFRSEQIDWGWDGFYKGGLCSSGTYIWKIFVKESNNDYYRLVTGHVNLIK